MCSDILVAPEQTRSANTCIIQHSGRWGLSIFWCDEEEIGSGGWVRDIPFQVCIIIITRVFICTRSCVKYSVYIIIFNPHSNFMKQVFLLSPIYRHWMRLNNLSRKLTSKDLSPVFTDSGVRAPTHDPEPGSRVAGGCESWDIRTAMFEPS